LRILFAIKSLHVEGGGAERVLVQVANGLAARGHEVAILTFDRPGQQPFYEVADHVALIDLGLGVVGRSTPRTTLLRALPALRAAVRQRSPDVAVGFMHSMYIPLGAALVGSGVPVIASEHQVARYYRDRPAERAALLAAPLACRTLTTTSEKVRDSFPGSLQRRMVAIPNPVPSAVPTEDSEVGRDRTILSVGALTEQKDHLTLVRAFASVVEQHPGWVLRIVGEGPLRAQLEAEAHRLGVGPAVELPGTVTPIEPEYRRATVFAISSVFESFGLVTAEALAHSTPVVGFADCPGTNELVVDGWNGLLVHGRDRVQALAEGLDRLLKDPSLRKTLAERAPASLARFRLDGILDKWECLLSVVSRGSK
jgi:GalNAc-alpha-(1->4)-GalNAc-alpha-(1->3)-diNAcBac-PP-undecaprenol alpha-1,4-N-acetyl-D-galactosaminyltransferase